MAEKLKTAGWIYLALAFVWVGIQIPIRLDACEGATGCVASLLAAPLWALIWPLYWPLSEVFPPPVTFAAIVLTAPLVAALLLVHPWHAWAEAKYRG
jgi:hypothetical protein